MQAWRYPEMLSMVESGVLTPDVLVTKTLSLSEGVDHLTRMDEFPGTGFTVIDDFTS
jgi:alcohol dehydrogenase